MAELKVAAFSSTYILKEKRYQSQITKSPVLIFRALLGDHGARDVRFERALYT
jgi:hypothetical protein